MVSATEQAEAFLAGAAVNPATADNKKASVVASSSSTEKQKEKGTNGPVAGVENSDLAPGPSRHIHGGDSYRPASSGSAGSDRAANSRAARGRSRSPVRRERRSPRSPRDYHSRNYDDRLADTYRPRGGKRSASRSPSRSPASHRRRVDDHDGRDYRDDRSRRYDDRSRRPPRERIDSGPHRERRNERVTTPPVPEEDQDRRTVFIQQLVVRATRKDITNFCSQVGNVKDVNIVVDRNSGRSKGFGYVTFSTVEEATNSLSLTGKKLMNQPVIVSLSEAEKNRAARTEPGPRNTAPPHRLYVGNVHFTLDEDVLRELFEKIGPLTLVQLQRDDNGRSKGYGFIEYADPLHAKMALETLNNKELAGRNLRVGLGNDRSVPDSGANDAHGLNRSGTSTASRTDRASNKEQEKITAGASALEDHDVGGYNYSNVSRHDLMNKLARNHPVDVPKTSGATAKKGPTDLASEKATHCLVVHNVFDRAGEEAEDPTGGFIDEIKEEFKDECEEKFGKVAHIFVSKEGAAEIFLRFETIQAATNAWKSLNGRLYGGFTLRVDYVVDAVYHHMHERGGAA